MTDIERNLERYKAAAHRMQTAVGFNPNTRDQEPKHLRVGINSMLSDVGGLATLLIEKGVITPDEYFAAIADAMEREADHHEAELKSALGTSNIITI